MDLYPILIPCPPDFKLSALTPEPRPRTGGRLTARSRQSITRDTPTNMHNTRSINNSHHWESHISHHVGLRTHET